MHSSILSCCCSCIASTVGRLQNIGLRLTARRQAMMARQDLVSTSRSSSMQEMEAGAFGTVRVEAAGGEVQAVKYLRRVRADVFVEPPHARGYLTNDSG